MCALWPRSSRWQEYDQVVLQVPCLFEFCKQTTKSVTEILAMYKARGNDLQLVYLNGINKQLDHFVGDFGVESL